VRAWRGAAFQIGGLQVEPGKRTMVHLPLTALTTQTPMSVPVCVIHAKRDGPVLFVSAAVMVTSLRG
jgi:hypothetical protein